MFKKQQYHAESTICMLLWFPLTDTDGSDKERSPWFNRLSLSKVNEVAGSRQLCLQAGVWPTDMLHQHLHPPQAVSEFRVKQTIFGMLMCSAATLIVPENMSGSTARRGTEARWPPCSLVDLSLKQIKKIFYSEHWKRAIGSWGAEATFTPCLVWQFEQGFVRLVELLLHRVMFMQILIQRKVSEHTIRVARTDLLRSCFLFKIPAASVHPKKA